MKTSPRAAARFLALLLGLAVAGCGDSLREINPFVDDVIDVACPPLGALREAEKLTRFRPGEGRDLTDVVFDARISRVAGKCTVTQSKVLADVGAGIEIVAERGPALEGASAGIEYFVAIRNPEGKIVTRQAFDLELAFEDGARETRVVDYLTFQIPNATPAALRAYRVFIGLQMTEGEWAFSRRSRQTRR